MAKLIFPSEEAGKVLISDAITVKGVATSASDSFQTMADNISLIETGIKKATGTFDYNNSGNTYTISGLSFAPARVILFIKSSGHSSTNYIGMFTSTGFESNSVTGKYSYELYYDDSLSMGGVVRDSSSIMTSDGFSIPPGGIPYVYTSHAGVDTTLMEWIAYSE